MPRSLAEWLDHQSRQHPRDIALGLERVRAVWQALGAPSPGARVVLVGGTNGKGSSVAFLDHILRAAGYRTGCYTSPHLLRYNERIRLDGREIGDPALCAAFERIEQARGDTPLTYFEYGTLAAILCMAGAAPDVAILEVGLGGRLDAVNILDADLALITGIALDHTDWLGEDLEQIAFEKAGIARPGRPLVYAAPRMPRAIADHARAIGARLYRLGRDYRYQREAEGWSWRFGDRVRAGLPLPTLRGAVQLQNAAGALAALALLPDRVVDQQAVREGLLGARVPGRFEVRRRACRWILDVAHNPEAAGVLAAQLGELYVPGTRHAVVGMLADKALGEVLARLAPQVDHWHLVDLGDEPRGASAVELAAALPAGISAPVSRYDSLPACLDRVDALAGEDDQVLVCGSFVTVGRALAWPGWEGS